MTVEPRVIRDDAEYDTALQVMKERWDDPSDEVQDALDVLAVLLEAYEREHHPLPFPDPIEAIMEHRDLTGKDLQPYIGPRSRVSEILNRKRPLNLEIIRRPQKVLGIPLEALVGRTAASELAPMPFGSSR